jgi:L-alanine-DL-glutamate epimerase-like enolase superfamily enzyme
MKTSGLRWEKLTLELRNPFRLSYGVSDTRETYWLRLADDSGWGEATLPPYYGVDLTQMGVFWQSVADLALELPEAAADVPAWMAALPGGSAPARCALEMALYDRVGRQQGLPLYQLFGLPQPQPHATSFTIAIDTPEAMAQMAASRPDYPIFKIKLGSEDDPARLRAIRAARPDIRLRVDANAAWSYAEALRLLPALEAIGLEMIEQPLGKDEHEAMGQLQKHTRIPLVADESVQSLADVERLAAAGVAGINVKLMKVGGLTNAVTILRRAQQLGLRSMLGCMIETSVGTCAMAQLTGLAEWIDLDAPLLIRNDPFCGLSYDQNLRISLPDRPGIGVILA